MRGGGSMRKIIKKKENIYIYKSMYKRWYNVLKKRKKAKQASVTVTCVIGLGKNVVGHNVLRWHSCLIVRIYTFVSRYEMCL